MYLDTDVILALIKEEDWLKGEVDRESLEDPKTSVITLIEVQLIYFESKSRTFLKSIKGMVEQEGIEILSLTPKVIEKSSELITSYNKLNVFDSVHLAHAKDLSEPIISTDTLYPDIKEVESRDPRGL